ncbi:acyltransferase [Methanobrevibacter sp. DSM 116169]|uniref:acyltransferase n=1 Tax=Methanobrevibacter sp. DSM 116169 TaxID=3242727 RepID=UPI0038FBE804
MVEENKSEFEEQNDESKLANQADELNHLTNDIIPKLKEENRELSNIKRELTDALEKSTQKYYEQLDINADLSDKVAKTGAELAIAKVKVDNLENEMEQIKEDSQNKENELKNKIEAGSPEELEKLKGENNHLASSLEERENELKKSQDTLSNLQVEVDDLRKNLIDIGNYKEQVDKNSRDKVLRLENTVTELETAVREKQRNYDRIATDMANKDKFINSLREDNEKLNKALESHSKRGLIDRLSNKPIDIDE